MLIGVKKILPLFQKSSVSNAWEKHLLLEGVGGEREREKEEGRGRGKKGGKEEGKGREKSNTAWLLVQ